MISTFTCFAANKVGGAQITTANTFWDFGRIPATNVQHVFELKNTGDQLLKIKNIRLSGKGIKLKMPSSVEAKKTAQIRILIDARSLVGDWNWGVRFETNDELHPVVAYTLAASVFQTIEFIPSRTVYFSMYNDEVATKRITIKNHGIEPFKIIKAEQSNEIFKTKLIKNTLDKEFYIDITVPKTTQPGRYQESITLRTNSSERPVLNMPVNIFVKNNLYASPEAVSFGQVSKKSIARNPSVLALLTQTVLLINRNAEFNITVITSKIPFIEINKSISKNSKTVRIDIGIKPSKLSLGFFEDVISIQIDDPSSPEIQLSISGEVVE